MMICHSSLLRALYLYTIASFLPLYFFGFITHSFVPYLQLMKKNKEKEYFICLVKRSPLSTVTVPFSVARLYVPTGLPRDDD